MIKVEGNAELFGFFTCVNMHENANKQSIQQIKEFVLSKAGADKEKVMLRRGRGASKMNL